MSISILTKEETVNSEFQGQTFTTKRSIQGWRNGFCRYQETVSSKDAKYQINCGFSDLQVDDLYESMAELIETFHPDIMVVCMHTKNYPNSSNRMLHEEYGTLIKDENIFEPIFTEDESKKIDEKPPMVEALYQHIVQIINTLKNE